MSATLYTNAFSQPSRAVQWFANYAGIPLRCVEVGLHENDPGSEFATKFPGQGPPCLEDADGWLLRGGTAILQYLADVHRERPEVQSILPVGEKEESILQQMVGRHLSLARIISTELVDPLFELEGEELDGALETGSEKATPALESYREQLSKQRYVAGDRLTLADFLLAAEVDQLRFLTPYLRIDILSHYPEIQRYLELMEQVPGYTEQYNAAKTYAKLKWGDSNISSSGD